ncbi:MAG: hypothetical protein R3D44_06730, partial [Hyphomicrobiaceae bacterium]
MNRKSAAPLRVAQRTNETEQEALARVAYDPGFRAAVVGRQFLAPVAGQRAVEGLQENLAELNRQISAITGGDLTGAERMLVAQANTLDAIFNDLARRAAANAGQYLEAMEIYMRQALRAQSQCRATLETLAAIKNPPVVIARQANVTTGPQQVNNGVSAPRAEEFEIRHQSHAPEPTRSNPSASSPALLSQKQAIRSSLQSTSGQR